MEIIMLFSKSVIWAFQVRIIQYQRYFQPNMINSGKPPSAIITAIFPILFSQHASSHKTNKFKITSFGRYLQGSYYEILIDNTHRTLYN